MIVRLVFLSGARRGTTVDVPEGELSIGRSASCALSIDDPSAVVSGRHAAIVHRDGAVHVRDTGSRNGTFVDGQRITDAELRPGQVIMLGADGPSVRVEYTPLPAATAAPATAAAPQVRAIPASGLTQLYEVARQRSGTVPGGSGSQTAVIKTFVRLAQERSGRRQKLLIGLTAAAGLAAVAAVFVWSERRAQSLRTELTLVTTELGALSASAADWQKTAETLALDLKANQAAMDKQRRQLEAQRRAVQSDGRFGPTVTERFASGVGLLQFRIGWHSPTHGWLRIKGTPDGKVSFTVADADHPALMTVSHCTGFLIDPAGWVLTNRHCLDYAYPNDRAVREGTLTMKTGAASVTFTPTIASVRVSFPPGRVYDADYGSIRTSQEHDLGFFRTTRRPEGVAVLPLARGTGQRVTAGEDIVMLSYPGGATTTAKRRGLGSFVDSSFSDQIIKAANEGTAAFIRTAGADSFLRAVGPLPKEPEKRQALLKSNLPLRVLLETGNAVSSEAVFDALSRAGQVHPDVSGRMSISGVLGNSISFHTLSGIGGSSGSPVISTGLVVIGVNHAGFAQSDRGSQFQQSEAVPIEFALRFLPPALRSGQ